MASFTAAPAKMACLTRAARRSVRPAASRAGVVVAAAADRELWYPGAKAPSHLDGSMLGDYGFDPLGLGVNKAALPYYREAELMNGRWAMAANAGILFTELVGRGGNWWETGAEFKDTNLTSLVAVEVALFAVLESFRFSNFQKTGEVGLGPITPFDPLKMKSETMKLKELKNARLAMLAFLGFSSQAAVRGLGPIACLQAHLADPGHVNLFTSKVGNEAVLAVIALSVAPIAVTAYKSLGGGKDDDEFRPIPW